jgi:hypothetical protein
MKRIVVFLLAAALGATAGVWAQSSNEPSEDYVLQQARTRYSNQSAPAATENQTSTTTSFNTPGGSVTIITTKSQKAPADRKDKPYSPFVFSFVPGISFPWGMYDTSFAFGYIGSLVGDVHGVQASGVFNIAAGEINGLQAGGVFNITEGSVNGLQGAGVFNIAGGDVNGGQGAGVFNIADGSVSFLQSAGVFNIAGAVNGVQSAGLFNIADSMNGVQAAGLFNVAGQAKGAMIGLVNVADKLDGVAIGLVNVIGNGINDLSIDYQYVTDTVYATYRSGTPFLYASYFAGQAVNEVFSSAETLTIGAGLGHRFRILFLTADVELCAEMPVDEESLAGVRRLAYTGTDTAPASWDEFSNALPPVFGSVRASFGFGRRKGFGGYLGIKTDFEVYGANTVPERLRKSSGDADSYRWQAFGTDIEFWPKVFFGLKF